jgi:predicted GTPase
MSVVTPKARDVSTGELLSEKEATAVVRGKFVLVNGDIPTLTHGGMAFGPGYALARQLQGGTIADPLPYATGDLAGTFKKCQHLKEMLPAMGYEEKNDF